MTLWILIIILSYLLFALSSFGDKLILSNPKNNSVNKRGLGATHYTFYAGVLNLLALLLIPFIPFGLPSIGSIPWIILDASVFLLGIYTLFRALQKFEVSKVVSTIGAIQPIFVFVLTFIFFGEQMVRGSDLWAFLFLLLGGFLISMEKGFHLRPSYIFLISFSSIMFSLDYIFAKMVFLHEPFLQGMIWIRICTFLLTLTLLLNRDLRQKVFARKKITIGKSGIYFLFAQSTGAVGGFLQSLAISLTPIAYLAMINSLRGIQYIFLFIITILFSRFSPTILKEAISKRIIIQKLAAIVLIGLGLVILVLGK